ncbi:MAG: hypothetical protein AABY83_07990 [Pseudomonadota bacterium]
MIAQDHPYFFLASIFAKEGAVFNLSRYVYKKDSLFDQRRIVSISGSELTPQWVNEVISSLEPAEELALHSTITLKDCIMHIPMIDFATTQLSPLMIERMSCFLPKEVMRNIAFFDSGRSYHAYSLVPLLHKEWIDFMGRLLLTNPRDGKHLIDTRWVGHRLIGGFCSLRWSNNTGNYIRCPSRVAAINEAKKVAAV